MPTTYGFHVDIGRCVQCEACSAACKATHRLPLGTRRRRVITYWSGEFPRVTNRSFTVACQHCASPACVEACGTGALAKRREDGLVLANPEACTACGDCAAACPYGAIQLEQDGTLHKCDTCLSRRAKGLAPACVATCPADALHFGPVELLAAREGARKVDDEVGASLWLTPPRDFDESAFYRALARAAEPSGRTALTIIT